MLTEWYYQHGEERIDIRRNEMERDDNHAHAASFADTWTIVITYERTQNSPASRCEKYTHFLGSLL